MKNISLIILLINLFASAAASFGHPLSFFCDVHVLYVFMCMDVVKVGRGL